MSFLSSHRLHWGEHDALTGHFFTHLELHVHDLPLHPGAPVAANGTGVETMPTLAPPAPEDRLPDVPGP